MQDIHLKNRDSIWSSKQILRNVYADLFQRIEAWLCPGLTVEVGGGTGLAKRFLRDTISSDIVFGQEVDCVADCHDLPFKNQSLSNIVMLDVLHHLDTPVLFLREASRQLRAGGRIIMIEPGITPVSWFFYKLLHEEPVDMAVNPFSQERPSTQKDPFDGNQAIPTIMFNRYLQETKKYIPNLKVKKINFISLFCYPLSGGFQSWSLLPAWAAGPLLKIEKLFEPLFGGFFGFRIIIVLEKVDV